MDIRLLTSQADLTRYGAWMKTHPDASLWQSLEWKAFQESLGREVRIYAACEGEKIAASALVVIDKTSFRLSTWEIPRGPIGRMENGKWKMENDLVHQIMADARKNRCVTLYASPVQTFPIFNFQFSISKRHVHPEATRILDLTLSDDNLLAQMKPKGRYNIRLAEKHGVIVKQSDDVETFAMLAKETAKRDGFRGHSEDFYKHFLKDLQGSFLLLAYPPSSSSLSSLTSLEPIAGLLGVTWGTQGLYYYGASGNTHRELMAPYLLQWAAMKHCRSRGVVSYDLFGIAPEGRNDHPWASVSDFKAKFGGRVVTYLPEQEITLRPVMKKALSWKRKILG